MLGVPWGLTGFRSGGSLVVVTQESLPSLWGTFPGWAIGQHCWNLTSFS